MKSVKVYASVPHYHGKRFLRARLPEKVRDWSHGRFRSVTDDGDGYIKLVKMLDRLNEEKAWRWPKKRHYFFSDLHADALAFADSLVASGGVKRTGPGPMEFELSKQGRHSIFVIGGDCFDKGPSALDLLSTIHYLIGLGADVEILAGNHDIRVMLGMAAVDAKKDRFNEHFFIRTGQKIIPLLKEISQRHVSDRFLKKMPGNKECRKRLFPSDDWFDVFPDIASKTIRPAQVKREISRIKKKYDRFEKQCQANDLSLKQVYAAVEKWKSLFMQSDGEFAWFYQRMRLGLRSGSFLFIHAGLDNKTAADLYKKGIKHLNHQFRDELKHKPFSFYYGPLCNSIRTKYRDVDHPLTSHGTRYIRRAGISAVIHGHRNLHYGQRISLRKSVFNFECDTSVDSHTRSSEGLKGYGAGVTIIEPKGYILGISTDYSYAKLFKPDLTLAKLKKLEHKQIKDRQPKHTKGRRAA
jgi:hypothetical protein